MKITKASELTDYNKYLWIRVSEDNILLTDDKTKVQIVSKEQGIAYYYINDNKQPLVWRFEREKGWNEDSAHSYIAVNGTSQVMNSETGKKLKSKLLFKNMKDLEEKMKLLAQLSNLSFHKFLEEALDMRLNVVKSVEKKEKLETNGFKFHGIVKAFRVIEKNTEGKDEERWRLKTTFTSNKADLYVDITSKGAIEKAVSNLEGKVIPIRFEHGSDDFGVWDTFKTYEKDGVFYGEAEGELDKTLNRSQDLWKEIYTYGKQFATSYGGRWIEFHWVQDDTTGEVIRVFDEIVLEEISLTTRPANPDTAMEAINKYAKKLEQTLDKEGLHKFISTSSMKEIKKDTVEATVEAVVETKVDETKVETPVEAVETETVKPVDEVAETTETSAPSEEVKPVDEVKTEEVETAKSFDSEVLMKAIETLNQNLEKSIAQVATLAEKVKALEAEPVSQKPIVKSVETVKDADVNEVEKAFKEKYPFMYMIASSQGKFNKTEE